MLFRSLDARAARPGRMCADARRADAPPMIRVLIADDHGGSRDGLGRLIEALPDIELAGVAADGDEAIEQCRANAPDVVLMDLDMPRVDGIDATRMITAEHPATAVLVL